MNRVNREMIENLHPAVTLREDYLPDYAAIGVTKYRIAKELKITQSHLDSILSGKRSITANTSLRLGKLFNQSPDFWLRMQSDYDLQMALLDHPEIEEIKPLRSGKLVKPESERVTA